MGIKVKLSAFKKFVYPNICVACGEPNPQAFVPQSTLQFISHGFVDFPICRRCGWYYFRIRDCKNAKERLDFFDTLTPEEIKRAYWASAFGGVDVPFFYLGKMVFNFNNDNFGILFWKLNGGEMREYDTDLRGLNHLLEGKG